MGIERMSAEDLERGSSSMGPELGPGNTESAVDYIDELKEKDEPTLGELNPLLYPPDLSRSQTGDALKLVAERMIARYGGIRPTDYTAIQFPTFGGVLNRFIARFEVGEMTEEQIAHLEELTEKMYRKDVKTRRSPSGRPVATRFYPELETPERSGDRVKQREDKKKVGWYMGPNLGAQIDAKDAGLLVYRDAGSSAMARYLKGMAPSRWFFEEEIVEPITKERIPSNYIVEVREGDLEQTEVVEFVAQVGQILGTGEPIEDRALKYHAYQELYSLGQDPVTRDQICGLDDEIAEIERKLVLPLANLGASRAMKLKPRSMLMVGIPGTGKTLTSEYMLHAENGVFVLPIDVAALITELAEPPEKRWIIDRITQVFQETGIPVVIHIDDIELLAEVEGVKSPVMNLMQGVRERGFFLLASTNKPEKFDDQLIQPDRFNPVYYGLPEADVRREILDVHATRITRELGIELFESDDQRSYFLSAVADASNNFTSRLLSDVCNSAKSFYLERVARDREQSQGLDEGALGSGFMTESDWEKAFTETMRRNDIEAIRKWDEEVRGHAENMKTGVGFVTGDTPTVQLFGSGNQVTN